MMQHLQNTIGERCNFYIKGATILISRVQQLQVEWRRDRVSELSCQGYNQSDIATVLHVDKTVISRDMAHLKQLARENLNITFMKLFLQSIRNR